MVGEGVPTWPKCFGVMIFWCYFVSKTLQSWDKRVFRRCWVKMTERVKWKSSQILQFRARFCRNCKFLFSHISRGPGGIYWQETLSDTHLEHPEKVPFLTERGRKRVKEWRYTTFMKEWMKALDKMRILSPAQILSKPLTAVEINSSTRWSFMPFPNNERKQLIRYTFFSPFTS